MGQLQLTKEALSLCQFACCIARLAAIEQKMAHQIWFLKVVWVCTYFQIDCWAFGMVAVSFFKSGLNQEILGCEELLDPPMMKKLRPILPKLMRPYLTHCSQSEGMRRLPSLSSQICTNQICWTSLCSGVTSIAIHQAKWHTNSVSTAWSNRPKWEKKEYCEIDKDSAEGSQLIVSGKFHKLLWASWSRKERPQCLEMSWWRLWVRKPHQILYFQRGICYTSRF